MLSLPSDFSTMITNFSSTNIKDEDLADSGREDYVHVTILYGFDQNVKIEEVNDFIQGCNLNDIKIVLGDIQRFTFTENRPESDVIYIKVIESAVLQSLNKNLRRKFNANNTYGSYSPHVTLAYVKPGRVSLPNVFVGMPVVCDAMTYSTGQSDKRSVKSIPFSTLKR